MRCEHLSVWCQRGQEANETGTFNATDSNTTNLLSKDRLPSYGTSYILRSRYINDVQQFTLDDNHRQGSKASIVAINAHLCYDFNLGGGWFYVWNNDYTTSCCSCASLHAPHYLIVPESVYWPWPPPRACWNWKGSKYKFVTWCWSLYSCNSDYRYWIRNVRRQHQFFLK